MKPTNIMKWLIAALLEMTVTAAQAHGVVTRKGTTKKTTPARKVTPAKRNTTKKATRRTTQPRQQQYFEYDDSATWVTVADSAAWTDDSANVLEMAERLEREIYVPVTGSNEKIFDVVEQMPAFPGGINALTQWIASNMKYPAAAVENKIEGRVMLSLFVEKDGSIGDVTVVRSVHPLLDKEATRVVKAMPRWTPGYTNGEQVRVKYTLPLNFKL